MAVIWEVVELTAEGAVVSAQGLAMYERPNGRVDKHVALVDPGDSTRRLGPERYHLFETGMITVRKRSYKRQLLRTTLVTRG